MAVAADISATLAQMETSRTDILASVRAGRLGSDTLRRLADEWASLALDLAPVPLDPVEHIVAAHAQARPHLASLTRHDPAHAVVADETHRYTPRMVLRRIHDHALDHLNQLGQWLAWRREGTIPTPTDGWVGSDETLPEDVLPLAPRDLAAWLWRIDLAVAMVAQRARELDAAALDWAPPDSGGWTLRHMLHHLASAETYYASWLDAPLPDAPPARYREATRRADAAIHALRDIPAARGYALLHPDTSAEVTPTALLADILRHEHDALSE